MRRTLFILPLVFLVLLAGCVNETPQEKGTIQFTSSPTGAQVYFDSQFRGTTPVSLTGIEPGEHAIEFRYPGYESWSETMVVSGGQNNVFAALMKTSGSSETTPVVTSPVSAGSTSAPVVITVKVGKDPMLVGDSLTFSGTAAGCKNVIVTLYGPGVYGSGISSLPKDVDSLGAWAYVWNPGQKILPGTYTVVVTDPDKTVSEKKQFSVIGNGEVTIVPNKYATTPGDTIQFSGLCTTNAREIQMVLYGPGQYTGGVQIGTISVQANQNWNFAYSLDKTAPTGTYTVTVYDVPKTTSGTTQFTVGYASS